MRPAAGGPLDLQPRRSGRNVGRRVLPIMAPVMVNDKTLLHSKLLGLSVTQEPTLLYNQAKHAPAISPVTNPQTRPMTLPRTLTVYPK